MRGKILASFAISLALSVSIARADSIASEIPVGAVYEESVRISRTRIPLPPGKWTVTSFNEETNNNHNVVAHVGLLNIVKGKMQGYIDVRTNVDVASGGWQPLNFCSRKDLYFLQVDANYPNEQSCWGINHIIKDSTSNYTPKYGKNLSQTLMDQGLSMPHVLIDTLFRYANRGNFVTYEVLLNPEYFGFSSAGESSWANSPWHKQLIVKDPRRQEFLDQIREQYAAFAPALRTQFR